ncbi:phage tail assembly chaperone G [Priestia megaterium]|uniref:phage tail assembly chaperone G n=1 Tax=Priestia megaterium TaxID=1404 RepID=UPI00300A79DC
MMDLVLKINGKEKTMNSPFISGMTYKKYIALQEKEKIEYLKQRPTIKQLDALIQLIVEAFDKQFTVDEFYAGLSRYLFEEKLAEFCLIAEGIPLDGSFNPEDIEATEESEADAVPSDTDSATG